MHFRTDAKQKSFIGGLASFGVTIFLIFFVYTNGLKMVTRDDATMATLAEGMSYEDVGKITTDTAAKVLFEILENGDNTFDLDKVEGGYQQYIHVRLNNIIKIYNADTKSFDRTSNYYSVDRCTLSNFHTEFEKQYYELKKSRSQYCIDQHEEIYLQGTRDSEILKQDHAYIVYEVFFCQEGSDATKYDGNPTCKPKKLMRLKDYSSEDVVPIE